MLVQFTVAVDGRVVGEVSRELSGTAAEIEEELHRMQQRTGRFVLEPAFQQIAMQTRTPSCCRRPMKNCGWRTIDVLTTCGPVPVARRRYRCLTCGHECYPADAQICCGRHQVTRPLAQRACQLATDTHFTRLAGLMQDQHGIVLGHQLLWELAHDVGTHAEQLRRADAAQCRQRRDAPVTPDITPKRVYVTLDGILYPTNLSEPDPDHPDQNRTVYQQMKVGAVYWQDEHEDWHKRMTWGREPPEEFAAALYRLACRCGYQQAQEKIFAADGADWCWDAQATYFSEATAILDWFHASEHVWEAARHVSPQDPKAWANAALEQLRTTGGTALCDWLREQQPQRRGQARTALDKLIGYVAPRTERMNYPEYRQRGWQIGTGMIESTCKQLVGLRLKAPGMHWSESGALAITALRATQLNNQWHAFWKTLALAI